MMPAPIALCFLLRAGPTGQEQVLLGRKKTGFGIGKMVGLGGHIEAGESAVEAACREVHEEAAVTVEPDQLQDVGTVDFVFPARPEWNMNTVVFTASSFTGEPAESEEIRPEWFYLDHLPASDMWQDAEHWLPPMLRGKRLAVRVTLNPDNQTVASAYMEKLTVQSDL